MKRIDRLILKELLGPWLFGVGLFTALLMAVTYLGRIAGFFVDGIPVGLIIKLTALYTPALMVKTFSMSVLLAGLLGFGRLSSDSEIVALRAGGASIYRVIAPVIAFSALIALLTFAFDEWVMPRAETASLQITQDIARQLHPNAQQPLSKTIIQDQKLKASVTARNVNPANQTMEGVTVLAYNSLGAVSYIMFADEVEVTGGWPPSDTDWRIRGKYTIFTPDFKYWTQGTDGWPSQIVRPTQPLGQLLADGPAQFDSMSMAQLRQAIAYHRQQGDQTPAQILNMEYGYWNKLAIPLAAITFGALGAVLGIRSHRTGTATGMALAIAIIFGYWFLANFMSVWAQGGIIPPWLASFSPLVIGALASGVIMWRRN